MPFKAIKMERSDCFGGGNGFLLSLSLALGAVVSVRVFTQPVFEETIDESAEPLRELHVIVL